MINLRHLRAFKAVAEELHFTKAAEVLCVTQPALSALIRQLELDTGVQLIHRNTRQVELTAAGVGFLRAATKLLDDFDEAVRELGVHRSLKQEQINIAALPSLCTSVLPDVLRTFSIARPDIRVNVIDMPDEAILEAVRSRTVHFGCTYFQPCVDIEAQPFMDDALVMVCHRELSIARHRRIGWKQLSQEPIIAMGEGTPARSLIEAAATANDLHLNIVLEPRVTATALAYAAARLGLAILPSSSVPSDLPASLTRIELIDPVVERKLCVQSLANHKLSPVSDVLRGLIIAAGRTARVAADLHVRPLQVAQ